MDQGTAERYAFRLNLTGLVVTAKTARETGPLASIWGIQVGRLDSRVYIHPDTFPPFVQDTLKKSCANCGTTYETTLKHNPATGDPEPWCIICYYGSAA